MVTTQSTKQIWEGPPPMDEEWWAALLAEEEGKFKTRERRENISPVEKDTESRTETLNWELARRIYEEDEAVTLQVSGYNRGGLLVQGEDLHGFIPISHLVDMPTYKDDTGKDHWLSGYLQKSLLLKIIECDQERGRVVFSERAALSEPGCRNRLLSSLKAGQRVRGIVTNITDFGVFVDLGGIEGLIHVSELSWGRVRHPSDSLSLGETTNAYVISVDGDRNRVALSLKRLLPNPWETADTRYFPGMIANAIITSIMPFGAFARLEEGLDGLIHHSEMGIADHKGKPADLLKEGQPVTVKILHIDAGKQRIGLSLDIEE